MLCVFSVYLFAKLFEHPSYTSYSRNGINQMCILKNSKDLVESL